GLTDRASVESLRADVAAACERVGRDPATIALTGWARVAVSADGRLDAERPDTIAGTPIAIAERLTDLHEAGLAHLTCFMGDETDRHLYPSLTRRSLERFAPLLEALRADERSEVAAPTAAG
ncbi:MAG TPA: hypothetical protein VEY67_07555, partial [Candidatus Dormibacteraeota bacterium]|nr:hypothetical protein [Candidatus Dormibacteraeota bacterium]